uniref:Transcription elongation factor B polypeptide 3 n=1 Tax=Lygus hesperus TaxID=30085 RepID=A0A0A9YJV5_LYGHE
MSSKSIVDQIRHYQKDIERCPENSERMIRCIQRLYVLPILVQHLQETGVGRSVNSLRKFNGEVGEAAKALVTKWKAMVAAEESDDGESAPVETDSKKNPPNAHSNENGSKTPKDSNNSSKHDSSRHSSSHKRSHTSTTSESKAERKSSSSSTDKTDRKSSSDKNDKHRHSQHESKSKETVRVKEEKGSKSQVSSSDKSSSLIHRSKSERKDKDEDTAHSPCRKKRKKNCVKERRKEVQESDDDSSGRDDSAKDVGSESDRILPALSDEDSDDQGDFVGNHSGQDSEDNEDGGSEKNSSSEEDSDPKSRKKSSSSEHHKSNSSSHNSSSSKQRRSDQRYENSDSKKSSISSSKSSSNDLQKMIKENEKKIKREKFEKPNYDSGGSTPKRSSSPIKSKEKSVKVKVETNDDGSIDAGSGFSFADALAGLNPSPKKKKKANKDDVLSPKPSSSSSSHHKSSSSSSQSQKKSSSSSVPLIKKEKHSDTAMPPELLKKPIKLESLELDINSTLPEINPNYRPLPHIPENARRNSLKSATNEEEMFNMMMNKNQRTKVFSGGKSNLNSQVPTLYDLCIKLLYDHVDGLEYTGGVPYDLLKPLLQKLNPDQLFVLEHYNAYLIEDTGTLWEFHSKKYFRNKVRQEGETWRDLYIRCMEEREEKLKALTQNITQSIAASTPVRKAKLAYVDSAVKPPRNVLRKQAKYGTGVGDSSPIMKAHAAEKREILAKAVVGAHNPANIATTTVPAPPQSSGPRSWSAPVAPISKKRKAPLMAKALQLIKGTNRFKR